MAKTSCRLRIASAANLLTLSRSFRFAALSVRMTAAAMLVAAPVQAQQRQPDFRWEKALAAGSVIGIHNLSGDVTVTPSTTGKVDVLGVKHGRDRDDVTIEVVETRDGISVCPMYKDVDMECNERGLQVHDSWGRRHRRHGDRDWEDASIDIEVRLPKGMELSAHSVSGNVSVVGAEGDVRAGSVSGDVRMEGLRITSLRASSVSGNVQVGIAALSGNGDLKFSSVSGDVTADLPANLDADVSMHTVSGSLDSDFPLTLNGRMSRSRLEARIGKGGRDLEVSTVSGNVRLRAAK